jgi:hypothetical protein
MRPLHTNRKRTTLNEAQEYIKKGIGGGANTSDYLSDDQRNKIVTKVTEELSVLVPRHFPRTTKLDYAILKGHLIIEHALTQFIRCISPVLVEIESIKFSFSQKLEIAILFGFGNGCPTLVPTIELFNKIRNHVVHKFEFNKAFVDEIIRLNCDEECLNQLNDRKRISCLRVICAGICGRVTGSIGARVELTNKETK